MYVSALCVCVCLYFCIGKDGGFMCIVGRMYVEVMVCVVGALVMVGVVHCCLWFCVCVCVCP